MDNFSSYLTFLELLKKLQIESLDNGYKLLVHFYFIF